MDYQYKIQKNTVEGARFHVLGNVKSKPVIENLSESQIERKVKHWLKHDLLVNDIEDFELEEKEKVFVHPNPEVAPKTNRLKKAIFKGEMTIPKPILQTQGKLNYFDEERGF